MPIRHHTELQCWQLADELRKEVNAICEIPSVAKHFSFCESFRDAAGSTCHNLAEGFARFKSGELAQFFRYGLASLAEVEDHLKECLTREFINQAEFDRLWDLAEHAKATALNFMRPHDKSRSRKR